LTQLAVILLGSNLDNRSLLLSEARKSLTTLGEIAQASAIYETAAWGKKDQPAFLNQVITLETKEQPEELVTFFLEVENKLGRKRSEPWAARTIDIDLLFLGNTIFQSEKATVPHPRIADRRFTLVPLCDVLPDFQHPVLLKTMKELLAECTDPLPVKKAKLR
jgi:2-amino-4-hydroxy-6-hydroxymethyldihydropteridine diphosphokinase